jgi:DNA-binding HxlR family transcriptional regulator
MRPGLGVGQQVTTATEEIDWQAAQAAVDTVSGKWTIPIIAALFRGPKRYGSLRRTVEGAVSDKVLAETLRRMERDGLLTRRVVTVAIGTTPAVFYSLSGMARSLAGPLSVMAEWHAAQRITRK